MIRDKLWRLLELGLFTRSTTDTLFNPYLSADPRTDLPNAPAIRRSNLRCYVSCLSARPTTLIVGEAPGPHGARFSGVPFTSEAQLCSGKLPFRGERSSAQGKLNDERTAAVFWDVISSYHPQCFVWNAVPLHPHESGEPLSVRPPNLAEVRAFADLLAEVDGLLRPEKIIAVGRVAERAVREIGEDPIYVRHPSHGGMREFCEGIEAAFANT